MALALAAVMPAFQLSGWEHFVKRGTVETRNCFCRLLNRTCQDKKSKRGEENVSLPLGRFMLGGQKSSESLNNKAAEFS